MPVPMITRSRPIQHLTQSNPNELSDIATGSNQSGSGIFSSARPAPASKQLMETDQMDGYEMVNRSPRTNKDDFEPVDPVPSARNSTNSDDDDIDNDTDVTDDDSDEQLMEIEEENQLVFKVPSTKPTRRNQRSRKTSNCEKCDRVNTRKLRSHEKVFRYSDDDDFD